MALFRNESKQRMNLFLFIDAERRQDKDLFGSFWKKASSADIGMMLEVLSMHAERMHAKHGVLPEGSTVASILAGIVDARSAEEKRSGCQLAHKLMGRSLFVDRNGEDGIVRAMSDAKAGGATPMDFHFAAMSMLLGVNQMLRSTGTAPILTAEYS